MGITVQAQIIHDAVVVMGMEVGEATVGEGKKISIYHDSQGRQGRWVDGDREVRDRVVIWSLSATK